MLRAFAAMVYPLVAILAFLSFYLVPSWQMPDLSLPPIGDLGISLWLAVPVVIFSFSHAAAISSFANIQRRHYGDEAQGKSEQILKRAGIMLVAFVLLFVFSCVLTLSPAQMAEAKAQNVSVLSYLANVTHNPFIGTLGPLVAFIAITSSFLGHFLGARESLNGLVTKHSKLAYKSADKLGVIVMFFAIWGCAVINPSILDMMGALSGPVIAMILFIMPTVAAYKVKALAQYRGQVGTYFIFITGMLAISALLYNLMG